MRRLLTGLMLLTLVLGMIPVVAASAPESKQPDTSPSSTGRAPVSGVVGGWPGPSGFGYLGEEIAFDWVDIGATGTAVYLGDDDHDGPFTIGFRFGFYGDEFTDFYIQSNGVINFANEYISLNNQCPLPTSDHGALIALYWDDLDPGNTSDAVYYETLGSCPVGSGACLVVQYENFHHYPGGGATAGTFQAILFDSGEIIIQFEDTGDEMGSGSTTGIKAAHADADWGLTYACDEAMLYDGSAIKFGLPEGLYLMPKSQSSIQEPGTVANYALTAMNFTGLTQELELTYTAAGDGTCYGPDRSDPIGGGGSWGSQVTIEMDADAQPGDMVNCTVNANIPEYSEVATIDVLAGSPIPAYALDIYPGLQLVSWPEPDTPGTRNLISSVPQFYPAADFVGEDYSTMYALDYDTNEFVTIDVATGARTVIGTSIPTGYWTGMTSTADGSTLYASSSLCGTNSYLYEVDPDTGALALIGSMRAGSCMIDIAINTVGAMYGVDIIDDALYSIDTGTGIATYIGSTGASANYAQGMDFDLTTGTLYWAAYTSAGELRTLDLDTGMSTLISPFPGGSQVDGLSIAGSGPEMTMHVGGIDGFFSLDLMGRPILRMFVLAEDENAMPLGDVRVDASIWVPKAGPIERSRFTKPSGWARFHWGSTASGTWTICVENLVLPGYLYNAADNATTCQEWYY